MRTELPIAGVVVVAVVAVVVVEFVICRLNFPTFALGTTPGVGGRGALGIVVGKLPKPPRPPRTPSPKGQSIVEVAIAVLGNLVRVYGMVIVASVVSRYAKVNSH